MRKTERLDFLIRVAGFLVVILGIIHCAATLIYANQSLRLFNYSSRGFPRCIAGSSPATTQAALGHYELAKLTSAANYRLERSTSDYEDYRGEMERNSQLLWRL